MRRTKKDILFYWLLFLINYPLFSEVTRRFIYYSDMFFVLGDCLIILTLALLSRKFITAASLGGGFYITAVFLLLWGLTTAFVHGNPMIALVGGRAMFIPFLYIFISAYFFSRYRDGMQAIVSSVGVWCFIISLTAVVQLVLGRDHPINLLPSAIDAIGIGNFTVGGEGLDYLFRPTSIFLHTGKFGQTIFALVLFKWLVLYLCPTLRTRFLLATIPIDIAGVIISGQRGAYLFLTLEMLIVFLFFGLRSSAKFVRAVVPVAIFVGLGALVLVAHAPDEFVELLGKRYLSGFHDVFPRIERNLFVPIRDVTDSYLLVGEGLGFFTLGAGRFGGELLYNSVNTGTAENSWLRLIGEMGILGPLLFAVLLGSLAGRTIRAYRAQHGEIGLQMKPVIIFVVCWLVAISAWAITHDVFSNSITMSIGFTLSGPAFTRWRKVVVGTGAVRYA